MIWGLLLALFVAGAFASDCTSEYNELLTYNGRDPMDDRAFIFFASMAKHQHDLGNYQFCSEKGVKQDLKYALLVLRVSDHTGNGRYIYGGS